MKIASGYIMREIDKYCIDILKIPSIVLMENAALKIIENLELDKWFSFTVVCGKGNNGGDGLAVARHLFVLGKKVEVFLIGTEENLIGDTKTNYFILKNMGIKINKISNLEDINELRDSAVRCDVVVDSIFGTGLSKKIDGIYDDAISIINENSKYILSVDVPSGFNSDNGTAMGNCVRANKTVTFQLYKKGFLSYGSDKYTGEIIVEDIGIPEFVIDKFHENEFIIDKKMIKDRLITRDKYSHKGDYGRILIVAGSKGFSGAAYIAAEGAVRSGAGLVTLCCSEELQIGLSMKLTEAMTISFNDRDRLKGALLKCNSIAIGPGMGNNEDTFEVVKYALENAKCPVVIDADGINVLKESLFILKNREQGVILTPHLGEMARITGLDIDYIKENRIKVSEEFAKEYGVVIILKGYNTIITDGTTTIINPTGNSSMASGGMGDCLTGIIASFIGQGYKLMEAAALSTYIHGYAGDRLSEEMFCVNASHILESLPYVIKELQQ
ncbi:NAD(P)H-hydrate dehydratase [Clostridium sp. YIM B02515]|uniref:Bifunctional NAD(P)H-hydrate repair enzyme n=1 Tax=Clostridium rhizosphaerae TaxID=2803861 RepID=A0ABS1TAE0_9CLOT|nr:NAD(P)H-hydrate dehydratase [Clostridium rhizosphaerae]MBL4936314.1 NAD(P)H-hydrate dehydratase [Clostridium rhizosphaerae]